MMYQQKTKKNLVPSLMLTALLAAVLFFLAPTAFAFDTIQLSQKIAQSLERIDNTKYKTVAFSRIIGDIGQEKTKELIEYTNVAIVKNRRLKVIDRTKLQLIIKEQQFNLSGMVSHDTYKELGRLLGVDLFIYGRSFQDSLVLKAIDVQSSAIVWAELFELTPLRLDSKAILNFSEKVTDSIRKDVQRLHKNQIRQLSFWSIQSSFDTNQIVDYLSVAFNRDNSFHVVDRENLRLILEEQKLGMHDFIDEGKAKKMGELYGIDGFIYGSVTSKQGRFVASLKLLNIYNGVIEWADLISFGAEEQKQSEQYSRNRPNGKGDMIFIPKGPFTMGSNQAESISRPEFKVNLRNDYYIDRTEVSNTEYKNFVQRYRHRSPPSWVGGNIPPGQENEPVVMVNWNDANLYCRKLGKRLPTEAEWEKAFRGENGRIFPWPDQKFKPIYSRTLESNALKPVDVDSKNADISVYGVQHLAGNVREWVDSYLKSYPKGKQISSEKVIRGGSWAQPKESAMGWHRDRSKKDFAWKDVGFRCAKSVN